MNGKIKIVGIGGSLESGSSTLLYLKYILNILKVSGAETQLLDVKRMKLPLFSYSHTINKVPGLKKILSEIHSADGLIFASPEYHGTVSASFKNVVDYMEYLSDYDPPYLTQKPVGCIALAGAENSGVATLNTMINIIHSLRGIAASNSLAVSSANKFIKKNNITSESLKRRLNRLASEVYNLSEKLR